VSDLPAVLQAEPDWVGDRALLGGEYPHVGNTRNAALYRLGQRVLAVVPFADSTDDGESSLESIRLQERYFRTAGVPGGSVIFIDRVLEQDRAARQNYRTVPDPQLLTGFALVTRSVLGRAFSAVYVGLSAPRVPTRVFSSLDQAMVWLNERNRANSTSE